MRDSYQLLDADTTWVSLAEVFDVGMTVGLRFFKNEASASTFAIKHQGAVRQASRFFLTQTEAVSMFETCARQYQAIENPKPWTIADDLK